MAREMKDSGIEWIGEIPADWNIGRIKHSFFVIAGATPKSEIKEYWDGDIVWITPADYKTDDVYISTGRRNLTAEGYNSCGTTIVPKNSIIFSKRAPIGSVAINSVPLCTNQGCLSCVPKGEVSTKLFYYAMRIYTEEFNLLGSGTTFKEISADSFQNFTLPLPPLPDQHRIAAFLDRKCAEIDSVIADTQKTIEEYKTLKQSIITEAVTKGVRGERKMKDSGIEWIKEIPYEWESINPKALFSQRKDKAQYGQRQLTASQQYGVIYQDEYMRLAGAKVVTVEKDFDILKQVEAGDFVISMRSFQGGLEYSTLSGSISSAYVMLFPNLQMVYPKFYRWLFKSSVYINALQSTSNMVRDGQAMRYSNFAQVRLYALPFEEQEEISVYLDAKCAEIDRLIAAKQQLLTELESYKKSVIYEYVTGKKECDIAIAQVTQAAIVPFYPAAISTKRVRFAQAVLMAKVLDKCHKGMGRVKLEKTMYTIETIIGFDFETEYVRQVAGPLDESLYKCEGIISRVNHWYTVCASQHGVSYKPTKNADKYQSYYCRYFGNYNTEIERIIDIFASYTTEQAEVIATLLAAWNDAIIEGKSFTDTDIVNDVLNNWSEEKKRFSKDVWLRAMDELRKKDLIPKGYGKKTVRRNIK